MITAPLQGVLLPLVTPFLDGAVDFDTVRSLVAHYSGCGITGFVRSRCWDTASARSPPRKPPASSI